MSYENYCEKCNKQERGCDPLHPDHGLCTDCFREFISEPWMEVTWTHPEDSEAFEMAEKVLNFIESREGEEVFRHMIYWIEDEKRKIKKYSDRVNHRIGLI
jgi:hypothetical protein